MSSKCSLLFSIPQAARPPASAPTPGAVRSAQERAWHDGHEAGAQEAIWESSDIQRKAEEHKEKRRRTEEALEHVSMV